ncbi:MAG TPA: hypothetical protein CFH84_08620 [Sulfurimonas sp. UBA12504]|nr:MAG: hypothetical protein A2019_09375 [Sulfurimonas sp. GWF2_37_8]DAB29667.1 MAG TPA: hypothetical protein CFH84_08620 [Sulfurimonas sp. UBA12504]
MDFFLKYKTVLFRVCGAVLLLFAFIVHFWMTPKEGVSEVELAAANVARMEASIAGSSQSPKVAKPDTSKFLEKFKNTQEKQMQHLTVIAIILGSGFFLYSFIKPKKSR